MFVCTYREAHVDSDDYLLKVTYYWLILIWHENRASAIYRCNISKLLSEPLVEVHISTLETLGININDATTGIWFMFALSGILVLHWVSVVSSPTTSRDSDRRCYFFGFNWRLLLAESSPQIQIRWPALRGILSQISSKTKRQSPVRGRTFFKEFSSRTHLRVRSFFRRGDWGNHYIEPHGLWIYCEFK